MISTSTKVRSDLSLSRGSRTWRTLPSRSLPTQGEKATSGQETPQPLWHAEETAVQVQFAHWDWVTMAKTLIDQCRDRWSAVTSVRINSELYGRCRACVSLPLREAARLDRILPESVHREGRKRVACCTATRVCSEPRGAQWRRLKSWLSRTD